jgi:hypothetical protein
MQPRLSSLAEAGLNTLSGFLLSVLVQLAINWWKHLPLSFGESLSITLIFTAVSLVRSYLWRRYFNWRLHRDAT